MRQEFVRNDYMKKKIGVGIGIFGITIIFIKVLLNAKDKKAASSNIIGRADEPTIIFLAGKYRRKKGSKK